MTRLLTDDEIDAGLADLPGWTRSGDEIRATYASPSFPAAISLVDAVAAEAERRNHHPDIDIRWRNTTWVLSTHDAGGLTARDIDLAAFIVSAANDNGTSPA